MNKFVKAQKFRMLAIVVIAVLTYLTFKHRDGNILFRSFFDEFVKFFQMKSKIVQIYVQKSFRG